MCHPAMGHFRSDLDFIVLSVNFLFCIFLSQVVVDLLIFPNLVWLYILPMYDLTQTRRRLQPLVQKLQ